MSDSSTEQALPAPVESMLPPPVAAPSPTGPFAVIDQLLRDRKGLLDRIEARDDLPGLARTMLFTIFVSAAVFGISLGLYRGGVQILFAGIKLPLVILLTAAFSTPALSALRHVIEGHTDIRRDFALVLSCLALGSLVISALAPLLMLARSWDMGYHGFILLTVGVCCVGGVVGLALFIRGTREITGSSRALIVAIMLLLVGLVGVQMTWTMRPYVVRPRTDAVPFVRSLEGSFLDSVTTSMSSALGVYHREAAPLPGEQRSVYDGSEQGALP